MAGFSNGLIFTWVIWLLLALTAILFAPNVLQWAVDFCQLLQSRHRRQIFMKENDQGVHKVMMEDIEGVNNDEPV